MPVLGGVLLFQSQKIPPPPQKHISCPHPQNISEGGGGGSASKGLYACICKDRETDGKTSMPNTKTLQINMTETQNESKLSNVFHLIKYQSEY